MTKTMNEKDMKAYLKAQKKPSLIGLIYGKLVAYTITVGILLTLAVWIKWGIERLLLRC